MLRAGIVGLPNVGKSTLFNAVTRTRKAESANYPFCTIDPNVGVVSVPDKRLDELAAISNLCRTRHPRWMLRSPFCLQYLGQPKRLQHQDYWAHVQ